MKSIDELKHRLDPLSVKEAAKLYGDSASNFYKKVRRGEVPGVFREKGKPRGRIKICPAIFYAWVQGQIAECSPCKAVTTIPPSGNEMSVTHENDH